MSLSHQPSQPPDTIHLHTTSPLQTQALGKIIGSHARAGDVIALVGDLGAGKTQMVRGIAQAMGVPPEHVSSPTFVLMQEYDAQTPATSPASASNLAPPLVLVHIDAYRLASPDELISLGWSPDSEGPGELAQDAVVVVEWADRIAPALGLHRLEVHLVHSRGTGREISLLSVGSWIGRLERAALEASLGQP